MTSILCVEADKATSRSIQKAFESVQMICEVTDSGEDGLAVARLYDYDAILLELMLPDISGFEVLLRLRDAKVKTPVVVISALTSDYVEQEALHLGVKDFIKKPFDLDDLISRVKKVMGTDE